MALFIISIILTVLSAIALTAICALWVYKDAKVHSEHAAIWALLSIMSFPIGLIIYILVGRQKNSDAPTFKNHYKIPTILLSILLVASIGLTIGTALGDGMAGFSSVRTGSFSRSMDWYNNGHWTFNASRANGRITRNPSLSAAELNTVFISSNNSEGEVRLILSQGDVEEIIYLSDNFSGYIDMSNFNPGRIRMRLIFDAARNVNTSIRWR